MTIDVAKDRYLLVKSIDEKLHDWNGQKYIIAVDKSDLRFDK